MIYEALLMLAVWFLPGIILEIAINASHTPQAEYLRTAGTFLVFGIYFVHQWSSTGQTLAMKTWRMKLVMADGSPVRTRAAVVRYVAAWMYILPAAGAAMLLGLHRWQALLALLAGIIAWALLAYLDKNRQFLHDRIAGTRLVQLPKPERAEKKAAKPA